MADKKETLTRLFEQAWSQGNVEVLDEILAPSFEATIPLMGKVDRDGTKQGILAFRKAFPDLRLDIQDLVVQGDKAFVNWNARGTSRGPFMGQPPTGKSETIHGLSVLEFSGDLLRRESAEFDVLKLMQAIGLPLPISPAQVGAAPRQPEVRH